MYGYPPPQPPPYGMMPYAPYGPYGAPRHPLLTVRNGAIVAAICLAGLLLMEVLDTTLYLAHTAFPLLKLLGWVRTMLSVGLAVGVAMMARLPRSFGAGLAGWSAFAFLVMTVLLSLWMRVSYSFGSDGVLYGRWFLMTMAYGAFTALPMIIASETGVRWGAVTNAFTGVLVGIWRFAELWYVIKSTDDDGYGGGLGGTYYSPSTSDYVMETLTTLPAIAALATLCFELRGIVALPPPVGQLPPAPPLAPPPGGYAPPPPIGGWGPPGPPPTF